MKGIVLFAHGARDPDWAVPFQQLQRIVSEQHPDSLVVLSYLELMSPSLPVAVAQMVAQGVSHISIVPLFLGPGAHLRKDFPVLLDDLRILYPQTTLTALPALGESEIVLRTIASWITLTLTGATA